MKKVIFVILCVAAFFYFQGSKTKMEQNPEIAALLEEYADGQIDLGDLPLHQAIKQVQGKGTHVLVTFEDPNCPYCSMLDKKLSRLDDITLYTFLFPVLSEDSVMKSRRIWCSSEPAAVWNGWMLDHREPAPTHPCDTTAIARNLEIGNRLGIRGVPYLLQGRQ
jgi:thiol:disulfide interchange protein DsbC